VADEDRSGSHFQTPIESPDEPRRGPTQEPKTGLSQQHTFWQTTEGSEALAHAWGLLTDMVHAAPSVRMKIKLSYLDDPPIVLSYGEPDEEEDLENAYTQAGGTLKDLEAHPT
jgi:hypothetical protein